MADSTENDGMAETACPGGESSVLSTARKEPKEEETTRLEEPAPEKGPAIQLTPHNREILRKLKEAVADLDKPDDDDHYYLMWLRARRYDLEKAESMLRNHLKFRKEIGADTILDWNPPEVLKKFFPCGFFGEDRDGNPVWYDNMGNLDFKGFYRSVKKEDIIKLKVMHLETTVKTCKEFSARKGRHIQKVTSVIDLENLSYQRHYYWPGIMLFREILTLFEANYPERTKRIIVVKAPSIFPVAYDIIKRFLHEYTRKKMIILGSNWQEDLQKYIAPDQLPQAYGGTRCEPDPWCTDYINPGSDVPPEYYLTNQTETSREEMERVVVARGSCNEVECAVQLPGSALWLEGWEFVSTDYDISFGCYFKGASKRRTREVVPMKRRNSHMVPESGMYLCERSGIYIIKFDNSYSWTRSKEVFYSVKVLPPDTDICEQPIPIGNNSDDEFFECDADIGLTDKSEVCSGGQVEEEATGTVVPSVPDL